MGKDKALMPLLVIHNFITEFGGLDNETAIAIDEVFCNELIPLRSCYYRGMFGGYPFYLLQELEVALGHEERAFEAY